MQCTQCSSGTPKCNAVHYRMQCNATLTGKRVLFIQLNYKYEVISYNNLQGEPANIILYFYKLKKICQFTISVAL